MKKTILLLLIVLLFGCKTKTVLVENIRNTKDSTENVELKNQLKISEFKISDITSKLESAEKKTFSLIEQLNISDSEKQNLKESIETTIKEYNDKGILIKETYSKKTSELVKDLTRSEEKNKQLQSEIDKNISLLKTLSENYNLTFDENTELNKEVKLLQKENSDLKQSKKTSTGFKWWLLLIGFGIGAAIFFTPVKSWIIKFILNLFKKIKL